MQLPEMKREQMKTVSRCCTNDGIIKCHIVHKPDTLEETKQYDVSVTTVA